MNADHLVYDLFIVHYNHPSCSHPHHGDMTQPGTAQQFTACHQEDEGHRNSRDSGDRDEKWQGKSAPKKELCCWTVPPEWSKTLSWSNQVSDSANWFSIVLTESLLVHDSVLRSVYGKPELPTAPLEIHHFIPDGFPGSTHLSWTV